MLKPSNSMVHPDKKDNRHVQDISNRLQKRLRKQGLYWENVVADTSYSSVGEKFAPLFFSNG